MYMAPCFFFGRKKEKVPNVIQLIISKTKQKKYYFHSN